jgi:hypothetical protein
MRDLTHKVVHKVRDGGDNNAKSVETEVNPEGGGVSAEQPG